MAFYSELTEAMPRAAPAFDAHQTLGPPFALMSAAGAAHRDPLPVGSRRHTLDFQAVPQITVGERGSSPSRPPLVASLEARRRSSSNHTTSSAVRIFDMGPPASNSSTSPGSSLSPSSAGTPRTKEMLELPCVAEAMQERDGTMTISITCDHTGTRVTIGESESHDEPLSTSLLLSALEDAKDKLLRSHSPSANRKRTNDVSDSRSARKRRASALESRDGPEKKARRTAEEDANILTIPSSDEYLQKLLEGFACKGYGSMSSEQRESLMMSTLSSTYTAFASKFGKAQAYLHHLRHRSIVCLGQRDEALSRLRAAEHRLAGRKRPGERSVGPGYTASVDWWSAQSVRNTHAHGRVNSNDPSTTSTSPSSQTTTTSSSSVLSHERVNSNGSSNSADSLLKITLQPVAKMTSDTGGADFLPPTSSASSSPLAGHSPSTSFRPSDGSQSHTHTERQPLVEYRDIQSVNGQANTHNLTQPRRNTVKALPWTDMTPAYLTKSTGPQHPRSGPGSPSSDSGLMQHSPDNLDANDSRLRRASMPPFAASTLTPSVEADTLPGVGRLLQQQS